MTTRKWGRTTCMKTDRRIWVLKQRQTNSRWQETKLEDRPNQVGKVNKTRGRGNMAARTLMMEQSRSDSSIASNEWFEGFSPTSHRPIISKDSEMYISATAVNIMPSITDSDETDQPLNQQHRDIHEQCNAMPATEMLANSSDHTMLRQRSHEGNVIGT